MRRIAWWVLAPCALAACGAATAQTSPSFKLTEHTLNAGGHPAQGAALASASYHVTLDALGGPVARAGLASASFRADAGFVASYPPPGEVVGLRIAADKSTWSWNAERSVGSYNLYRDLLQALPGTYGTCLQSALATNTWVDPSKPPLGKGWFYIVTARNRLREEGTKGRGSSGAERPNAAPCP